ncbi:exodeoxyribonuclease VII small subunit [Granulicoccus phenolivorans]|uniref:exodeoxyribonuclease VII small subunit n=1 Tax=Granulicoccus phenolivorans TaxID=266854 RepID=UPI000401CD2B|nr:exodeoxyribonuclease VII small subunit [Granulicoccus phenolivorans]
MPDHSPDRPPAEAAELSYEAAREELIKIVQQLEAGGGTLAESLQLWERGEHLAEVCQRWLDGAKQRIEAARAARTEDQ